MTNKQAQITINAIKFMLDNAQYSEDVEEALDMAIETLSRSETPNGWIPCSERLPSKNGEYLVTGRQGAVNKRKYEDGHWYGNWAVLAWMPLPEPWKGEEE